MTNYSTQDIIRASNSHYGINPSDDHLKDNLRRYETMTTPMKLRFFITEYVDGNLEIETKHMHYAFRDDMNYDDLTPDTLYEKMNKIKEVCKKENIIPYFELR